jgi:hypothetical protein
MAITARSQLSLMHVDGHRLEYNALPAPGRTAVTQIKFPHWVTKYRWWIFTTLFVFYAIAFTGDWRIGRDSALYRGMGHGLATGHGFGYSEFGKRQIYPGLPLMLAGLEKAFGGSAVPPLIVMHLMALGCLITTYKLVSLRFSQWLAICVTVLVGFNGWFVELANEILTDIPFLFGLLLALYGWERLRIWGIGEKPSGEASVVIERASKHPWASLCILLIGLALAAVMRPTFWIVGAAWGIVCVWGLLAGPGRKFYAICLSVLLIVWIAVLLLDPRVKGFNPLGGGYEREAVHSIQRAGEAFTKQFPEMLSGQLAYSLFGSKWGPGLTEVMTVIALAASLMLLRINPLWTLLIALTVITTLIMTTVPRYYTMVMPLMVLAWMLLAIEIAWRVPVKLADTVLILATALIFVPSVSRVCKVIGEQRHLNRDAQESDAPKWKHVLAMADIVRKNIPQEAKVIGPGATIMRYVSDRQVLMWRDLMPTNVPPQEYPQHLAKLNITYAIFPPTVYRKGEGPIRDLMEHGVIVPVRRISRTREMVLAQVQIVIPPGDWQQSPMVDVMTPHGVRTVATTTQPAILKKKAVADASKKIQQNEREKRLIKAKKKLAAMKKYTKAKRSGTTHPAIPAPR